MAYIFYLQCRNRPLWLLRVLLVTAATPTPNFPMVLPTVVSRQRNLRGWHGTAIPVPRQTILKVNGWGGPVYCHQACRNSGEGRGNKWVVSRHCCLIRPFMKYLHWSAFRQPQLRTHCELVSQLRKYLKRLQESYLKNTRHLLYSLNVQWSSRSMFSSTETAHSSPRIFLK
jgi:hypothetical protein